MTCKVKDSGMPNSNHNSKGGKTKPNKVKESSVKTKMPATLKDDVENMEPKMRKSTGMKNSKAPKERKEDNMKNTEVGNTYNRVAKEIEGDK